MSELILFFYRYHEREGIVPVDSFVHPNWTQENLNEVNYYIHGILQNFIQEPLNDFVYVENKTTFDPEEEEGYGYVYAEQLADNHIKLSGDTYEAAVEIVKYFLYSKIWLYDVLYDEKFTFTGYSEADIPLTRPTPVYDVPEDSRYTLGEVLVSPNNKKLTYAGVLHDPVIKEVSNGALQVNSKRLESYLGNSVLVGLNNNDYVREVDVKEFIASETINVFPLPLIAKSYVLKGSKWFAQVDELPKIEAYGKTQKEAKENLAVKALFERKK